MELKKMVKTNYYKIHCLLSNNNELKVSFLTPKSQLDVRAYLNSYLPEGVTVKCLYSCDNQAGPEWIDEDLIK